MSYCTTAQLFQRYDNRIVAQLSGDSNGTVAVLPNVQAALDDGTADINMACLSGGVYAISDLLALVAGGDTALVRLNADLAMRNLARRRAGGRVEGLESAFDRSQDMLNALRHGQRVLNISSAISASYPVMTNLNANQVSNLLCLTTTSFFGGAVGTPTINGEA